MSDTLKHEIKNLIIDRLGLEEITVEDIGDDLLLFAEEGLGLDSVDALELGLAIQKRYHMPLESDNEKLREHFTNVNALTDWIKSAAEVR